MVLFLIISGGGLRLLYESARRCWFFYCLFLLSLVANLIFKNKHPYLIALLLLLIGYASYPYKPIDVLKHFQIIRQWPLFILGLACKEHGWLGYIPFKKIKGRGSAVGLITFLLSLILYCVWLYFATVQHRYLFSEEFWFLTCIILIVSSYVHFVLFRTLYPWVEKTILSRAMSIIGQNSLGVYVTNGRLIMLYVKIFRNSTQYIILGLFGSIILTTICCVITMLLRRVHIFRIYLLGEK